MVLAGHGSHMVRSRQGHQDPWGFPRGGHNPFDVLAPDEDEEKDNSDIDDLGAFFSLDAYSECSECSLSEGKTLEMIEGGDLDCSTLDEVPMFGRTDGILEEWHFDENLLAEEESCSFLLYGKTFSYYDIELFEELFYKDFAGMDWGSIPHLDLGEEPFCEEEEL